MKFKLSQLLAKSLFWVVVLLPMLTFGQKVQLLGDISSITDQTASSSPNSFTEHQGEIYFIARNSLNGNQLWKTDGTEVGTKYVATIDEYFGATVLSIASFGDKVFFAANDGNGTELWVAEDDTSYMVIDIAPGDQNGLLSGITATDNYLYFAGYHPTKGTVLYRSDGTASGTVPLTDASNNDLLNPSHFNVIDGTLYFSAYQSTTQFYRELYSTKGSSVTTTKHTNFQSQGLSLSFQEVKGHKDKIYFTTYQGTNRTVHVLDVNNGTITDLNQNGIFGGNSLPIIKGTTDDYLFFSAYHQMYGVELWKTNGTIQGTNMIKDINPGAFSAISAYTTVSMNGYLYFTANENNQGFHIWRSDGTPDGTTPVAPGIRILNNMVRVKDKILFMGSSDGAIFELWESDGTEEGTKLLKELNKDPNLGGAIGTIYSNGDKAFFSASDGVHGYELWVSDATPEGTFLVKDIDNRTKGTNPYAFTEVGNKVFFIGDRGDTSAFLRTVYVSDGTFEGTRPAYANPNGLVNINELKLTPFNNEVYFSAITEEHGLEVWKTNGVDNKIHLLKDIAGGNLGASPSHLTVMNNRLYFSGRNSLFNHSSLYSTDGTEQGTKQIWSGFQQGSGTVILTVNAIGDKLFMVIESPKHGYEAYVSDGTEAGTKLLKDICPGSCHGMDQYRWFEELNGQVLFPASNPTDGAQLWTTDGTYSGTKKLTSLTSQDRFAGFSFMGKFNGKLYFAVDDGVHGYEMWVTDGTDGGTFMVKDIFPGNGAGVATFTEGGYPNDGEYLYFLGADASGNQELWKTDGTEDGTTMIRDINATRSANIRDLTYLNHKIYFSADDGIHGGELWVTDGTFLGTHIVEDIAKGLAGSNPRNLARVRNRLYFMAFHPLYGYEPFYVEDGPVLADGENIKFGLSPNPANSHINIEFNATPTTAMDCVVYDRLGRQVLKTKLSNLTNEIDVSHLTPGMYITRVEGFSSVKWIKY